MNRIFAALLSGILFGLGLTVSQMINPSKVLAFLDLAGAWDPSLAFVMGGALGVTAIGYPLVLKRAHPMFAQAFQIPTINAIDMRLVGGSALFGVGWGLSGYCPGPAISALSIGGSGTWIFFLFMMFGMYVKRFFDILSLDNKNTSAET